MTVLNTLCTLALRGPVDGIRGADSPASAASGRMWRLEDNYWGEDVMQKVCLCNTHTCPKLEKAVRPITERLRRCKAKGTCIMKAKGGG